MNAINLKHEFLGLFKLNVFYSMFKIRKGFEKCIEENAGTKVMTSARKFLTMSHDKKNKMK